MLLSTSLVLLSALQFAGRIVNCEEHPIADGAERSLGDSGPQNRLFFNLFRTTKRPHSGGYGKPKPNNHGKRPNTIYYYGQKSRPQGGNKGKGPWSSGRYKGSQSSNFGSFKGSQSSYGNPCKGGCETKVVWRPFNQYAPNGNQDHGKGKGQNGYGNKGTRPKGKGDNGYGSKGTRTKGQTGYGNSNFKSHHGQQSAWSSHRQRPQTYGNVLRRPQSQKSNTHTRPQGSKGYGSRPQLKGTGSYVSQTYGSRPSQTFKFQNSRPRPQSQGNKGHQTFTFNTNTHQQSSGFFSNHASRPNLLASGDHKARPINSESIGQQIFATSNNNEVHSNGFFGSNSNRPQVFGSRPSNSGSSNLPSSIKDTTTAVHGQQIFVTSSNNLQEFGGSSQTGQSSFGSVSQQGSGFIKIPQSPDLALPATERPVTAQQSFIKVPERPQPFKRNKPQDLSTSYSFQSGRVKPDQEWSYKLWSQLQQNNASQNNSTKVVSNGTNSAFVSSTVSLPRPVVASLTQQKQSIGGQKLKTSTVDDLKAAYYPSSYASIHSQPSNEKLFSPEDSEEEEVEDLRVFGQGFVQPVVPSRQRATIEVVGGNKVDLSGNSDENSNVFHYPFGRPVTSSDHDSRFRVHRDSRPGSSVFSSGFAFPSNDGINHATFNRPNVQSSKIEPVILDEPKLLPKNETIEEFFAHQVSQNVHSRNTRE